MARARFGASYWKLWAASGVSNVGDGVVATAFPLLAASLSRDPMLVGGVAMAASLPWLLFALVSGAVVDRLDRRTVLWATNLSRAAVIGGLGLAVWADVSTLPLVYAAAFVLGVGETLADSAAQTLLPSVVRPERLEAANGRLFAVEEVANVFVGPPLGGALFAVVAAAPFFADAASFLIAALLVLTVRGRFRPERQTRATAGFRGEIREGVRWLWDHRLLRTLALMLGTINLVVFAGMAVFVLYAQDVLGVTDVGYGFVLASAAVGSVIGSLLTTRITAALGPGRAILTVIGVLALTQLAIGLTSSTAVVVAAMAASGMCAVIWNVITVSLRQTIVPDRLLGRVNSVYRFLGWGSLPVGALVGGALATLFGIRAPFLAGSGVLLVMILLVWPVISTRTIERAKRRAARAAHDDPDPDPVEAGRPEAAAPTTPGEAPDHVISLVDPPPPLRSGEPARPS
ncbi:MAG: MFS transporter [Acidimicrobiales bacterium]|nr:MFS transporter [Acidimicrobiales bacterium]